MFDSKNLFETVNHPDMFGELIKATNKVPLFSFNT
jgi:hypothetical protein